MRDLIEALTIMLTYGDNAFPTHCEHDIMYVYPAVPAIDFTQEDKDRLRELHFTVDSEFDDAFSSTFYGSC